MVYTSENLPGGRTSNGISKQNVMDKKTSIDRFVGLWGKKKKPHPGSKYVCMHR